MDHIRAVARGGATELPNLAAICLILRDQEEDWAESIHAKQNCSDIVHPEMQWDSEQLAEPPIKRVRLIVSSADRNLTTHPDPNNYTVSFDEPFVDVASMSLLSASFPLVAYQIGNGNNEITWTTLDDGRTHSARIPLGDYEPTALATELSTIMNTAVAGFHVQYDARKDGYVFSAQSAFSLVFSGGTAPYGPQETDEFATLTPQGIVENVGIAGQVTVAYRPGCPARVLGFGPANYDSEYSADTNEHTVRSPYRRDVSHTESAVIFVDGADLNVSQDTVFNRCYAIIGPKQATLEVALGDRAIVKNFNPPMGKLNRLRIRVFDRQGGLYDCQNHDHRLELLLTCKPKYQARPNWTQRA